MTAKPWDLQGYQAQLRKKLDDDLDTPSLSRFLSASQGAHLKYLACQSNSQVNESYYGNDSQKNGKPTDHSLLYGLNNSSQANNYKKFADTFLQRSTDKTKEKKEHSSIFDSVPSIDLSQSKDELKVLMKSTEYQCGDAYIVHKAQEQPFDS